MNGGSNQSKQHKKKRKRRDEEEREKPKETPPTVSIAVSGSIIDNAQSLDLATLLAGQIARAATIFRIDEVVVFDNKATSSDVSEELRMNDGDENERGAAFSFENFALSGDSAVSTEASLSHSQELEMCAAGSNGSRLFNPLHLLSRHHYPSTMAATAAVAVAVAVLSESSTFYGSPRSSALPSPLARCYSSSAISLPNSFRPIHIRRSILPRSPRFYVSSNAAAKVPEKKKVLIVNTNSGGHAVIGFYLARDLLASGHEVTILTVGDASSDDMKKTPFNRFLELVSAGGKTVWGDPAEVGNILGSAVFDVVLDNNGKDLDTVKPVVDWAKSSGASQFLFISSAGIYKTSDEVPHVEGDPVKEDAGHAAVEKYIASLSFSSWAIFRPQYMIGSGNNKDCEEWFFDRIVRDRPVPIPGSGVQLTNISHVRDLSSMLVLAVENPAAASGNIFNCVCDRAVTFNGLAKLCAEAASRPLNVVYFDPKAVGVDARKAFPFRNMHFYAEPRAAKEILGWTSTTNLPEDLKERFEEYVSIGRDKKEMKFETDDKILEYLKVPVAL